MDPHVEYFQSLTPEEEHLIILRDMLYAGDWREVVGDLQARKDGKPFVFKLNTRIEEDLQRIEKLNKYEKAHGIDLGFYLIKSGKFPELAEVLDSGAGDSARHRVDQPGTISSHEVPSDKSNRRNLKQ